jgi:hypothetical protein
MDPPRHDELRRIVRDRFVPKAIASLEHASHERVQSIGCRIQGRGTGDLAAELARPLPLRMVGMLLGFPPSDDAQLGDWFGAMVQRVPGTDTIPDQAHDAADAMRAYIDRAAGERLVHPSDDVLGGLVAAEARGELSAQERTGICVLLFLAGISTAAGLISTSLYLLAGSPKQRSALVRCPSLARSAVEELLRFVSPVQALARTTTRPVEIHGETVPTGARVLLVYGAANRDPRRFAAPDRLDVERDPARNLGFGEGIHFCLGAHLARLQTRVVLETLLPLMPNYSVCGPIRWMATPGDRGLEALPVEV